MSKFHGIQDDLALGVGLDQLDLAVGVLSRANIETRLHTEIPRPPSSQLCMDEDAATNRTKQCLVEDKGPLENFPHTDPWIEHGLPEKIEGEFGLWQ
jgi:hypothetical protein